MSLHPDPRSAVSDYHEFPAPPRLASNIICLWTQTIAPSQSQYTHRVLPDGCADIVLSDTNPPVVVGPWTDPFDVRFTGGTSIVGARLHPGRVPGLLGLPASELLNRSVLLDDLWSRSKTARFARILDERHPAARRSLLAVALEEVLRAAFPSDEAVAAGIRWLGRRAHGTIDQLSRRLGMSSRQLQRRFNTAVGYGPKTLQSVLRFQRLLSHAGTLGRPPLADLAVLAGYADQAHMTREVRRFSGCLPTLLFQSKSCTLRLSDLFKTVGAPKVYL